MNSRYELKRVLLNLTALLMALLMLVTVSSCAEYNDDENDALQRGTIVGDMPYEAVARVEFVKLTYNHSFEACASKVEYVFKIKDLIYSKRPSWELCDGQTLTFEYHSDRPEWLKERGYVYEEGKEYVIMFSPGGFAGGCYIPLYDLDKCCELIKKDSEYYGFPLDVSPDEFVANLSEVIDKLKAYYNGELSEWPFPENDENK